VAGAVGKSERRFAQVQGRKCLIVSDTAESKDGAQARQGCAAGGEKRSAVCDFFGRGFVLGRDAADGVGDHAVDEFEAIDWISAIRSLGEPVGEKGGVEELAGVIPGEWASGAIGTLQARRKADNEKAGVVSSKRRDRCIEPAGFVLPIVITESS
jgi:hypothetical protein